ncbi:hypothetical protein [Nocardioides sp. MH1]|uniref:hypothetical protein n=1 Tax=Nocardioides sp. MH1 TaxID=3242490 RepID=UPI0035219DDF
MHIFSRVRGVRCLAVLAVATMTVLVSAGPSSAGSHRDPRSDVSWRVEGVAQPTSAEKARGDIVRFTYTMGRRNIFLTYKFRNWAPCPATGECANHELRAMFTNRAESKAITVWVTAYGRNPDLSTHLWFDDDTTGASGALCDAGQITRQASNSDDTLSVKVPRSCFKRGWRFATIDALAAQSWHSGDAYRDGYDFVDQVAIDWTPRH